MSLARHLTVVRDAWREENKRRAAGRRTWVDTEFLPAALEVIETPPSPVGRAILWVIIAATLFALLWSFLSSVDTVAIAEGRLAPAGHLQSLEASEPGIVRAISVRAGDHVTFGQPLIILDSTVAEADADTAATELSTAALVIARANAILGSTPGRPAKLAAPVDADPRAIEAEQQQVDIRVREYSERREALEQRRRAAEATVRLARSNLSKLRQTLPLAENQMKAYETLAAKGYGSQLRLNQERERFIGMRQDLDAQAAQLDEAQGQASAAAREIAQAEAEFRGEAARERAAAEGVVSTRSNDVRKAEQRRGQQVLRAPVSGTVQQVALTTLGQVAQPAKPLVTLVADGEELVVEAMILNRDRGFVHEGDPVVLKLEAYPFTRYGTLKGRISRVSPDSIVDEKRGLVFPATVRLTATNFSSGRNLRLSPGMSTVVEVITGRRRVIDFIWSPIARATAEAGRER